MAMMKLLLTQSIGEELKNISKWMFQGGGGYNILCSFDFFSFLIFELVLLSDDPEHGLFACFLKFPGNDQFVQYKVCLATSTKL
jgi:hypothetical protein